jgi:diguanylate cyclase (GGDEF)-like protein
MPFAGTKLAARADRLIEGVSGPLLFCLALALIVSLGALDLLTGPEISFSIFYLAPIALVAWRLGRRAGLSAALAAGLVWWISDTLDGIPASHPAIRYWNSAVRLGFFAITAALVAGLRDRLRDERERASTDSLTGARNSRAFHETLEAEILRARRHPRPLSLAYIDLDRFKEVNDSHGHRAGDRVLTRAAGAIRGAVRATDVVGRLGGDEFAVLLPETPPEAAAVVAEKIRALLERELSDTGHPVTASLGVVTFLEPPRDAGEIVHRADDLMYAAKRSGRNVVAREVVGGASPA